MTNVREIYDVMCRLAPLELAESWDNPGLLVNCDAPVMRVLTCLDITGEVAREARDKECQLIVAHHPVIFDPVKALDVDHVACRLLQFGISAICMHTNLDAAEGGVNDTLAELVGLKNAVPFAGGMGRIGNIEPLEAADLAQKVAQALNAHVKWADGGKPIRRLAVVSGAGGSLLPEAIAAGAEALLTGEASHHVALDAIHKGVSVLAAGHYETEFPIAKVLATRLQGKFPELEVLISQSDKAPFSYL